MEVNQELENKLWGISDENPLDKETCDKIIDYLLARLSDYLKITLEIIGETWIVGSDSSDEFSCNFSADFREIGFSHRAYDIKFGGIIAVQLVDNEYGVTASTNLYLFGSHERLFAGQKNRNYVGLDYLKNDNNFGEWFSHGWLVNEFDEFEEIQEESEFFSLKEKTS